MPEIPQFAINNWMEFVLALAFLVIGVYVKNKIGGTIKADAEKRQVEAERREESVNKIVKTAKEMQQMQDNLKSLSSGMATLQASVDRGHNEQGQKIDQITNAIVRLETQTSHNKAEIEKLEQKVDRFLLNQQR